MIVRYLIKCVALCAIMVSYTTGAAAAVYFIHPDHLGTPRVVTDQAGTVVWRADYEPFGKANITTSTVTMNLRLPGQYFDSETGLHYNYFRDYDPATGRYLQSDPIGLDGGINVYAYASNNPVNRIDPDGLADISGFTRHGVNQAINRGVSPSAMIGAVRDPIAIRIMDNGTIRYTGDAAVVVLNPAGAVVTCWSK